MSDQAKRAAEQVSDQARFVAREFIARWKRETGEVLTETACDRMTFSYEAGYLRGRSDGMRTAMDTFDEMVRERDARTTNETRKAEDDNSESK